MRRAVFVILLTGLVGAPVVHGEDALPTARPANADVLSLCRTYRGGGEAMAQKVADILTADPNLASDFARLSKSCDCDQSAAIALGVSRATSELQKVSASTIRPMYRALTASCTNLSCRPRSIDPRRRPDTSGVNASPPAAPAPLAAANAAAPRAATPAEVAAQDSSQERCEIIQAYATIPRPRLAESLKVRAPKGEDCFCALVSSLATQAFAQGTAGDRIGFFPDEGGFAGGGIGGGNGNSEPVTTN